MPDNNKTKHLVLLAVFTALITVVTMVVQIPVPGTKGYINVGDAVIFATALLLGGRAGLIAGGLGSALADILTGYAHWAPWTLIIKGLEGLIAGVIGSRNREKTTVTSIILATLPAAAWMVFGYYLAGGFIYGFPAALGSIPQNLIQGGGSIAIAIPLVLGLRRAFGQK